MVQLALIYFLNRYFSNPSNLFLYPLNPRGREPIPAVTEREAGFNIRHSSSCKVYASFSSLSHSNKTSCFNVREVKHLVIHTNAERSFPQRAAGLSLRDMGGACDNVGGACAHVGACDHVGGAYAHVGGACDHVGGACDHVAALQQHIEQMTTEESTIKTHRHLEKSDFVPPSWTLNSSPNVNVVNLRSYLMSTKMLFPWVQPPCFCSVLNEPFVSVSCVWCDV